MIRKPWRLLLVLLVGSFPLEAGAQLQYRFEEYMKAVEKVEHFSGAVLVAKGGKPVFSKGFGMANYELSVPNTPKTVFRIASLTKAFTAVAIMQLQESGKLNIHDPIGKHLDGCPPAWEQITIRHLLTHTSGIPNYTNFQDYVKTATQPSTDLEIVARFANKPLEFAPGTQFKYCNSGYHLLGMIVARASGQSYADYLRDHIFTPLGMTHSGVDATPLVLKNRAAGYTLNNATLVHADFQDMAHLRAEGGIYSTTEDMLMWDQAFYSEKLLKHSSLDEVFTPFLGIYGYGWNIIRQAGRTEIKHSGLNYGFSSHIKRFPNDKVTVIVLSNNQMTDASRIAADLSAIAFNTACRVPRLLPKSNLQRYIGPYAISPERKVEVSLKNGSLYIQEGEQAKSEIFAYNESDFFMPNSDVTIEFRTDNRGNITEMLLSNHGRTTKASKLPDGD